MTVCDNIGFKYITHENICPNIHLNVSEFHLNKKGNAMFVSNLKGYLDNVK